jgi:hypothetical protein
MSIQRALGSNLRWPQFDKDAIFGPWSGYQLQHLTCRQILAFKFLSSQQFLQFFKFAIIRNPYDRLVSEYYYDRKWNKKTKSLNFKEFVLYIAEQQRKEKLFAHYKPQFDFVTDENGDRMVDFIGKYENLNEDWERIRRLTGFEFSYLPRINQSNHGPFRDYYDRETISIVNEIYTMDFGFFGYAKL